jgi:hypothetical protein
VFVTMFSAWHWGMLYEDRSEDSHSDRGCRQMSTASMHGPEASRGEWLITARGAAGFYGAPLPSSSALLLQARRIDSVPKAESTRSAGVETLAPRPARALA